MQRHMKKNFILTLVAFMGFNLLAAHGNGHGEAEVSIRNFRFARHNALDFERLVIEFTGEAHATPNVKISSNEKETRIQLRGVQLAGGIPEAAINDSYKNSSKYFGPVSINTDSPEGGVLIRAFAKKDNMKVDAFWITQPSRLIVDVFPENSERSFGREVLGNREFASAGGHSKKHAAKRAEESSSPSDSVVCYPASSQVKPSIGYDKRANAKLIMKVEDMQSNRPIGGDILCFPSRSLVMPTLSFQSGEPSISSLFQGHFDEKAAQAPAHHAEQPRPQQQPVANTQDQLNMEADEMMGFADEPVQAPAPRAPTTASQYDDSFNKNNPPPTLGKTLLPPIESGGSGHKSENQGANPATLLPPLK